MFLFVVTVLSLLADILTAVRAIPPTHADVQEKQKDVLGKCRI